MNKSKLSQLSKDIAAPVEAIASSQRVAILLAIGQGEACVCHLETALGWRQAYISQHLMALRKAGILEDRREGRYVYYRLKNPAYLDLLIASAEVCGIEKDVVFEQVNTRMYPSCECPHCVPAFVSASSL